MIGDNYQTASLLSFYLKDKHLEGPGHPPVYIPESQDIENEFSFWPRYDEFVEADPSAKRDTTFSEEAGINPFIDRTALYITDNPEASPPQNLQSAFTRWELLAAYQLDRRHLPSPDPGVRVLSTRPCRCDVCAFGLGHYSPSTMRKGTSQCPVELESVLISRTKSSSWTTDRGIEPSSRSLVPLPCAFLEFEKNAGQSGIYAGLHAGRGQILVLIDGDLQNARTASPPLLAEIEVRARTWSVVTA